MTTAWISVEDGKPDEGETVNLYNEVHGVFMGHISHSPTPDAWVADWPYGWAYIETPPTHWAPLMRPPGKEKAP